MKHKYSDALRHTRIAVLGPLPPPLGGVSVHIERVIAKLKKQENTVYQLTTTRELRYRCFALYCIRLLLFVCFRRPQLIIYHTTYLSNAISELQLLVYLKKRMSFDLVLVEHDCRFVHTLSTQKKKRYKRILEKVNKQIFIGSQTQQNFIDTNLICLQESSLEAAFLPPAVGNEKELLAAYPDTLHTFIQCHTPIIVANAFQMVVLNGKDLYGFDQLIKAFSWCQQDMPNAGLVLLLAQKGDDALYSSLLQQVTMLGIQNNVHIVLGNRVLWPLFKYTDLFIRPTLSDGASVSIQEAVYFGVPVIASNVCRRPKECVVYKAGDKKELYLKIKRACL